MAGGSGQLADALILLSVCVLHNAAMLNLHELRPQDFVGLSPDAAAELAAKVLQHIVSVQWCRLDGMPESLAVDLIDDFITVVELPDSLVETLE